MNETRRSQALRKIWIQLVQSPRLEAQEAVAAPRGDVQLPLVRAAHHHRAVGGAQLTHSFEQTLITGSRLMKPGGLFQATLPCGKIQMESWIQLFKLYSPLTAHQRRKVGESARRSTMTS